MSPLDRATIVHFHRDRIAQHGDGIKALGWRGTDSQSRRFAVIAAAVDFTESAVLDLGCGRADLKAYLDTRFTGVSYLGIDQMPEFIDDARREHGHCPRSSFHLRDFSNTVLPVADYVVASGALSYRSADVRFHYRMIARMFSVARHAVIFNLLDAARFPEQPLLIGHDVHEVTDFCHKLAHVEVVQSDEHDDFTVVMRATDSR